MIRSTVHQSPGDVVDSFALFDLGDTDPLQIFRKTAVEIDEYYSVVVLKDLFLRSLVFDVNHHMIDYSLGRSL